MKISARLSKLIALVVIFSVVLISLPRSVFAADETVDHLNGNITGMQLKPDGRFDVSLVFSYDGAGGILDDLSNIEIWLQTDKGSRVYCNVPSFPNLPSGNTNITVNDCDFRSAGVGPQTLRVKWKYRYGLDCEGLVKNSSCRTAGSFAFENIVGATNDHYIADMVPLGAGGFRVKVGGLASGADTAYRVRVEGALGSDLGTWPISPIAYSCSGISAVEWNIAKVGGVRVIPDTFNCDFSAFQSRGDISINLAIYLGSGRSAGNIISRYTVNLSSSKAFFVDAPKESGTAAPNDLNVKIKFFAAAGISDYYVKVTNRSNGVAVSRQECKFSARGIAVEEQVKTCDFSDVNPSGSYNLTLFDSSGSIIDTMPIVLSSINPASIGGTCGCYDENAGALACTFTPTTFCWAGFEPKVSSCGLSCSCRCVYNSSLVGPGGVPLPPLDFDLADFQKWAAKGQQYIIAFGVFASIFIVPYFGVLLASGNPENIEKGIEWAKSWGFGLLLLLLSSFVIRIIGSDILGF